jgi:glutaredoxin
MTLTLYTKPGCHLCAELRALLDDLQPEFGYDIEEVDITQSIALFQKYRYEIPVLIGEGVEVARGKVTAAELRSRLPTLR